MLPRPIEPGAGLSHHRAERDPLGLAVALASAGAWAAMYAAAARASAPG